METENPDTETNQTETQEQAPETQTQEAPKAFDPSSLTDDVKKYVEAQVTAERSKYQDYEKVQGAAREWEQVKSDPRFVEWTKSLSQPQPPKPFDIDDERFIKAQADKGEFIKLVQEAAADLLKNQVGPQLQRTEAQVQFQNKLNEVKEVAAKYKDFNELDKQGKIEPLIRKYPFLSFEDAYWLAKKDTFEQEVDKRARGLVDQKKTASLERPGNPPAGKSTKVQVKSRVEAMELAYDAASSGRPIPEFEFVGE